jgi:pilus assembly protein Flp/PilA
MNNWLRIARSWIAGLQTVDVSPRGRNRVDRGAERGQGMVEYALVLVLIAVVVIVIIGVVGAQVNNVFSNISNGMSG